MASGIRRGTMTLLTQDVMVQANIDVNPRRPPKVLH